MMHICILCSWNVSTGVSCPRYLHCYFVKFITVFVKYITGHLDLSWILLRIIELRYHFFQEF